jgi:hypothetical protein
VCCSYHHDSAKTKLFANLGCFLLFFFGSKLVSSSSDVVDSTKVDVEGKGLLCHFDEIFIEKTLDAVDESQEFNIFPLGLESQKTINDVICTWSLSSEIEESDSQLLKRVDLHQLLVKLEEFSVVQFESLVDEQMVLSLYKVSRLRMVLERCETIVYHLFDLLGRRVILFNTSNFDVPFF